MKQLLLICAVVMVGCGKKEDGNTGVVKPNKPSPKAVPNKLITDHIVEEEIREQLKKPTGVLTNADLERVTRLYLHGIFLSGNQLTSVKGLENLTNLEGLWLDGHLLTSVKGLEKLDQLTWLYLAENRLIDVAVLEKLTQLTRLNLDVNQLTELPKGLEKLTKLDHLSLEDNQLTDLKGLKKLTQLKELDLRGNPDLTKAQIDQLQKALPNCDIRSNPTK